jgi:hypothetical protein
MKSDNTDDKIKVNRIECISIIEHSFLIENFDIEILVIYLFPTRNRSIPPPKLQKSFCSAIFIVKACTRISIIRSFKTEN